jgi:hypothetical protein
MTADLAHPKKLYRYSERKWLERSLRLGEFRLRPAADYKMLEVDPARHDDELVRSSSSPADKVRIIHIATGKELKAVGEVRYRSDVGTNYLTLCFSKCGESYLFDEFAGSDACLVVHEVDEFCERIHSAAERLLAGWAGMDASVIYGGKSPLGAVFSKPLHFAFQHEWRFAWHPPARIINLSPVVISIGSIEKIAEIVNRPSKHETAPNTALEPTPTAP